MTQDDTALLHLIQKSEVDSQAWDLAAVDPASGPCQLMFLNAHAVTLAARNAAFREAMLGADHLLRDGIGVALGMQMLGLAQTENLNGTDLIPKILQRYKDRRIAVWGSSEEALEKLGARLMREGFDTVVSLEHGFHEDAFYLERHSELDPDIVVLCMGMPRQELLTGKLMEAGARGLVISGGGWANFYSGHIPRAPLWVRRLRLEWLHRLGREPLRLGKRYSVDIAFFFWVILRLRRRKGGPPGEIGA